MKKSIPIIVVIVLSLITLQSCEQYNKDFPYVRFDRTFDLFMASNHDLYDFSGCVIDSTVGYKGIVVYRRAYEQSYDDFMTFDLTCTSYECNYQNTITVNSFDIFGHCDACNTTYDMLNFGFPIVLRDDDNHSNNRPLKSYKTVFDGRYVSVRN